MGCCCGVKKNGTGYLDSSFVYYNSQYVSDNEMWALCGQEYKDMEIRSKHHENDGNVKFAMYKHIAPDYATAKEIGAEYDCVPGAPCLVRYFSDVLNKYGQKVIEMLLVIKITNDAEPMYISSEMEKLVFHEPITFLDKNGEIVHHYNVGEALVYLLENTYTKEYVIETINDTLMEYLGEDTQKYNNIISLILGKPAVAFPYTELADIYQIKRAIGEILEDVDGEFSSYVDIIADLKNGIGVVDKRYEQLVKDYAAQAKQLADEKEKTAQLETELSQAEERVSELDASVEELNERIIQLNTIITVDVEPNNENYGKTFGSGKYKIGDEFKIHAIPNDGFEFLKWNDGNTDINRKIVIGNDSLSYEAIFVPIMYRLKYDTEYINDNGITLTISMPDDSSTITYKANECPDVYLPCNTYVELFATNETEKHEFSEYMGYKNDEPWTYLGTEQPLKFVVKGDSSITALYNPVYYPFLRSVEGNGTIEIISGEHEEGMYPYQCTVVVKAVPSTGWEFSNWADDESETSVDRYVTILPNKEIKAVFKPTKLNLYIEGTNSGPDSPTSIIDASFDGESHTATHIIKHIRDINHGINYGTDVSISCRSTERKAFVEWNGIINGIDVTGNTTNPYVFNATKDTSVYAVYEILDT